MENIIFKKLNHFPAGCKSETLSDVFWRNMYSHKPRRQSMVERTHSHLSHWWASLPPTWGDRAGRGDNAGNSGIGPSLMGFIFQWRNQTMKLNIAI